MTLALAVIGLLTVATWIAVGVGLGVKRLTGSDEWGGLALLVGMVASLVTGLNLLL